MLQVESGSGLPLPAARAVPRLTDRGPLQPCRLPVRCKTVTWETIAAFKFERAAATGRTLPQPRPLLRRP